MPQDKIIKKGKKYKYFPRFRAWIIFDENGSLNPFSRYIFINRSDAERELQNFRDKKLDYPMDFGREKLTIRSVMVNEVSNIK